MKLLNTSFILQKLSLEDTIIYKGMAILMIVLHNFLHWTYPKIGENEMSFRDYKFDKFIELVSSQPEYIFQAFFSYFGHFGVQIFIFLSAYGLTMKYIKKEPAYLSFLFSRLAKIYPAFLFSLFIWAIYKALSHGGTEYVINYVMTHWQSFLYKLFFIANLIPHELYAINGPWWFLSLIIQIYILFPLFFLAYNKMGEVFLMSISLFSILVTAWFMPLVDIKLHGTIIGHIPEISLGVFLAKQGKVEVPYSVLLILSTIFYASNEYQPLWGFGFISALFILLVIFQWLNTNLSVLVKEKLFFIGSISMYIYYINGFMRYPWYRDAQAYNAWYSNLLLCAVFLFFVISIAYFMQVFAANFTKNRIENT